MKLAAIDIGSNAIRLKIVSVLEDAVEEYFLKKIEYIRFPLRLGHDVFQRGTISELYEQKFLQLMQNFKNFINLYEVEHYYAVATSAFREADNGARIAAKVKEASELEINVIDGAKEAEYLSQAIMPFIDEGIHLHIDVGGGSTELNVYQEKNRVKAASFKLGSVRLLEHREDPHIWEEMREWINENVKNMRGEVKAVGTGGNINKIYDLSGVLGQNYVEFERVKEIQTLVSGYETHERIFHLKLNPDRADVIVPASEIYLRCMEWSGAEKIVVPQVGLLDGVILWLYEEMKKKMPV